MAEKIYKVRNKATGIVHTVKEGHFALTDKDAYEVVSSRKKGSSTKGKS